MTLVRKFNHPFYSVMNDLFNEDVEKFMSTKNAKPQVNVLESEKEFSLELIAPGLKKEDFKIKIEDDMLSISSEVTSEHEEKAGDKVIRREYSHQAFSRSFSLPEVVDSEQISANYNDGILKLILPKKPAALPKRKEISIN